MIQTGRPQEYIVDLFCVLLKRIAVLMIGGCLAASLSAQDLAPRAYVITPVHSNAVNISYSFFDGALNFGGVVPITNSSARVNMGIVAYYHSFNFFGRSANFSAVLPYAEGNLSGTLKGVGTEQSVYRSGLFDSAYRFSVNLYGGPAMAPREFVKWRQKTVLGASIRLVAPTGQYDPTKLINWGSNRWALKSELGFSRRRGHWLIDAYAGGWYYSTNAAFFSHNRFNPGTTTQKQSPIFAFEGHVSYDVRPRLWASFDGNFWHGGTTSLNGVENPSTVQDNSRIGATLSTPVTKHQSFKFSYSNGAYIKYGGNFQNLSIGWQYSWIGRPN
jgi:hypothetical protein